MSDKIVKGCIIRMKKNDSIRSLFFKVSSVKGEYVYAHGIFLGALNEDCPFIFNRRSIERVKSISMRKNDDFILMFSRYVPSDTYLAFTPARNDVIKEHYDIIHFHSMNGRHLYLTYKAATRVLRRNEKSIKLIGIELA